MFCLRQGFNLDRVRIHLLSSAPQGLGIKTSELRGLCWTLPDLCLLLCVVCVLRTVGMYVVCNCWLAV